MRLNPVLQRRKEQTDAPQQCGTVPGAGVVEASITPSPVRSGPANSFEEIYRLARIGSAEATWNGRKARISGPFARLSESLAERTNGWLGREGSNLRMAESKSAALPLGYAPIGPSQGTAQEQVTLDCPRFLPPTPVYREKVAISTAAIVKIPLIRANPTTHIHGRAAFSLLRRPDSHGCPFPAVETSAVSWEDGSSHRGVTS